jgi:hypothetical protein
MRGGEESSVPEETGRHDIPAEAVVQAGSYAHRALVDPTERLEPSDS